MSGEQTKFQPRTFSNSSREVVLREKTASVAAATLVKVGSARGQSDRRFNDQAQ